MAQLQLGHCAFAASCVNRNAKHVSIPGTNRIMCAPHAAMLQVPSSGGSDGNEFSVTGFRPSRGLRSRRSRWMASLNVGGF